MMGVSLAVLTALALLDDQHKRLAQTTFSEPLPSKPLGYGVHLSKAARKGKSFEDLQRLREGRL